MIYYFSGRDTAENRRRAQKMRTGFVKERPNTPVFFYDALSFDESLWCSHLEDRGLFDKDVLVYARNISENKTAESFIISRVQDVADSKNHFIFVEDNPSQNVHKTLTMHARVGKDSAEKKTAREKTVSPSTPPTKNLFSITDALGKKDRRLLWARLEQALMHGTTPEEILNVLFWQVKTIVLVKKMDIQTPSDAARVGIKPYPFRKASAFSRNFTERELTQLSSRLTRIAHAARYGERELDLALERFALSL